MTPGSLYAGWPTPPTAPPAAAAAAAPPPPAAWPTLLRPNPDTGATTGPNPVDLPLTDQSIMQMDKATFTRRWPEIEQYMNGRTKR